MRRSSTGHGAVRPILVGWLLMGAGCERDESPPRGEAVEPSPPAAASPDPQWRFVPTLEQFLPEGAVAQPVLELSEPRQRTVLVLAAVLRAGAEHVQLERWTYEQIPDQEDGLRVREAGTVAVALHPGPAPEGLDPLRRRLAAPSTVLTRPVGLDADGPAALVERVATELATVRNPGADARARVTAAATVVRALDDTVLLSAGAVASLSTVLVPAPAELSIASASDRRATVSFDAQGRTVTLQLQRKSDGWAIVSAEFPPVPVAPTTAAPIDESAPDEPTP